MPDIFVTLTYPTIKTILKHKNGDKALVLYLFYYCAAKFQKTNKIWTTTQFSAKGLNWSKSKIIRTKKILIELGLIVNIPANGTYGKAYIQLNYIIKDSTTNPIFIKDDSGVSKSRGQRNDTQMLKGDNSKCLKEIKSFSKEKANALFSKGAKVSGKTVCKRKDFSEKIKKKASKGAIFKHKSVKKKRVKSNGTFQDHCQEHPKGKYIYTTSDISCYQQLKKAGATKHNETKKSYFKTMDAIHALFSTRCKMPYLEDPLAKEFKNHNWTIDEVLKAFNYYITYHKAAKTVVSDFIITTTFKGNKTWSPLLSSYLDMMKINPKHKLTAYGIKLRQAFKRHDKIDITEIDFKIINKIGNEISEIDQKYKFLRDFHDCPFGFYDYFVRHFLPERLNDSTFKLDYMYGKTFINQFIDSMVKKNTIRKRTRWEKKNKG